MARPKNIRGFGPTLARIQINVGFQQPAAQSATPGFGLRLSTAKVQAHRYVAAHDGSGAKAHRRVSGMGFPIFRNRSKNCEMLPLIAPSVARLTRT
jgi:hypothetical protein